MASPFKPVTLGAEQVDFLNQRLADMRHNVNNYLSLISAAAEIVARKPELMERMMCTLTEQPNKITHEIRKFSDEFEQLLGIVQEE